MMQVNRCVSCMKEIESYPCPHCGFDPNAQPQLDYALPWNTILHGKFLIGKVLGQGGFGITYVGWDLSLDVKVAVKEFFPAGQVNRQGGQSGLSGELVWNNTQQSEELRHTGMESFLREAKKMARIDRIPEIVRVRETFYENGTAYIIMDFVEGETLKARLEREGPLSFDAAMKIFRPIITAMERVHEAGLIHRDLSPDNIMLEPGGAARILDLGAAKDLTVNRGASSMVVAKGGFSPLEQYGQRGGSGTWTDVYAMAATIYYTLTGIVPPNAADRVDGDELRWDLPVLEAVPAPAQETLKKAMTVSPKDRTQTMAELLAGLDTPGPGPVPGPQPVPDPQPVPKSGYGPKKIALICAAVAAAMILIVALGGKGDGESADDSAPSVSPSVEVTAAPTPTPTPTPTPEPNIVIASGEAGDSVTWTLDDAGVMTVSGKGEMKTYDFDTFEKRPWESYIDRITAVVIERGVTVVGGCAFRHCDSLTSVTLPKGLQTIEDSAFSRCYSLTSVTLPEGLQTIEWGAFLACDSLTSVTLPEGLQTIESSAFGDCTNLTDIYYAGTETQWMDIDIGISNNEELLGANIHYNS